MKVALIDTTPKDMRNQGTVNLGFEIVKNKLKAKPFKWYEKLDSYYDCIAFNIFYPTNLFNLGAFLKINKIEPYKYSRNRKPYLIAGGQGIGYNHLLSNIVDKEFIGEIDYKENSEHIISGPVISQNKEHALVELTRGCKYRCTFCEYSWNCGKYREKEILLLVDQIKFVKRQGIKRINFMSANLAGYSKLKELFYVVNKLGIKITNSDICLRDAEKLYPFMEYLPKMLKVGVESFDEKTRFAVGKKTTQEELYNIFRILLKTASAVHLYLIYGLPDDNHNEWFKSLKELQNIRKDYTKNIRIEMNITNFEPCYGTPLSDASEIDFKEKKIFLKQWTENMVKYGFYKHTDMDYKNSGGRIGRKELSYKFLMMLKKGGNELTDKIINLYPKGIRRSILDRVAEKFVNN